MKKTADLPNPDPSIFSFYCPPNRCWCMSDDICVQSLKRIAKAAAAGRRQLGRPDVNLEAMPRLEHCIDCEIGKKALENRQPPAGKKRGRPPKNTGPCSWPGCRNKAHAYGLCKKCLTRARQNSLFKLNTKGNTQELENLIPMLAEMARKSGKPVGEVAYRAMVEGASRYLNYSKTGG